MYLNLQYIVSSLVYSAIGIVIFIVAYKIIEKLLPFDVNKEISEDHNTSLGIVIGSVMLGLALIIASAIHG